MGYYTSRSEFKQIYHDGSAFFRAASMMHALARDERTWHGGVVQLLTLWRALGLAQHHDIITGDCYDSVAEDNALRVRAGVANAAEVASAAAAIFTQLDGATVGEACTNYTLSPCSALVALIEQRAPAAVTIFNPHAWSRVEYISVLSPTASVVVTDGSTGSKVPSQVHACVQPLKAPRTRPSFCIQRSAFTLLQFCTRAPTGSA